MTKNPDNSQPPITQAELYAVFQGFNAIDNGIRQDMNGSSIRSLLQQRYELIGEVLKRPYVSEHAVVDVDTGLPVNSKQPKLNKDGSIEEPADPKAREEFRKKTEAAVDDKQVNADNDQTKTETGKTKGPDKFHQTKK